jgi:hypothetical protein
LAKPDPWRRRQRTLRAMALLCGARILVNWVPLARWRRFLGLSAGASRKDAEIARAAAADVEWGAKRLPFETKCLPRAMAVSWLLRRKRIGHAVVVAVRPPEMRGSDDALHAWVEVAGETLVGDLPGPWIETLRLGE